MQTSQKVDIVGSLVAAFIVFWLSHLLANWTYSHLGLAWGPDAVAVLRTLLAYLGGLLVGFFRYQIGVDGDRSSAPFLFSFFNPRMGWMVLILGTLVAVGIAILSVLQKVLLSRLLASLMVGTVPQLALVAVIVVGILLIVRRPRQLGMPGLVILLALVVWATPGELLVMFVGFFLNYFVGRIVGALLRG